MIKKPAFKPHLHVEIIPPQHVYLFSEKKQFELKGRLYVLLAPYLNGQHTVEEMVAALSTKATFFEIYQALIRLEKRGYLAPQHETLSKETAAFWHLNGIEPPQAEQTAVSLITLGQVNAECFVDALDTLGVAVRDDAQQIVVLTDDYLQPELAAINQRALQENRSWLLAKPVGVAIWLGPLFVPTETGCWACLSQRLEGQRVMETAVMQLQQRAEPLPTAFANNLEIGMRLAATAAAKWAVSSHHDLLKGHVQTFDVTTMERQTHRLTKRSQCPVCGQEQEKSPVLKLESRPKIFTSDGGHRQRTPAEMVAAYRHHVSPITGIVGKMRRLGTPRTVGHVYLAPYALQPSSASVTRMNKDPSLWRAFWQQSSAAGKGKSDLQAQASLIGEAIERYSLQHARSAVACRASYEQLAADAIHPAHLLHFSERQHAQRTQFDETKKIDWTAVWSLTQEKIRYLPTAVCDFNHTLPDDHQFATADSNGAAAGNSLEEAILQGFMELVERDGIAIWWYNRLRRPAVALASFRDPYLAQVETRFQEMGRSLWVIDVTTDLGIPTFAAISALIDGSQGTTSDEILLGFGTHFDPQLGILRAITELYQLLGETVLLKRSDVQNETTAWLRTAKLIDHPYLVPDAEHPFYTAEHYSYEKREDIRDDVEHCVGIVAVQGLETLVLDFTQPDIGLSVVKVFVPGLRYFWQRLAPGRLYDVPVKMGWLSQPLAEADLNPVPMFL